MSTASADISDTSRPRGSGLLRDGITFLVLCFASVVLFGLTLLLFHSFEEHRVDLAREYSERGRAALRSGNPEAAVAALRVALSYEPDDVSSQFALAQALAAAGHRDEALNYFLTLWEQRPGEGITNLQLARLERARGDSAAAVNYYRAAIFGNWEGDGVLRRRDTRLEMADYLMQTGNEAAARQELLIAAGNAPPEEYLEVSLGDRLEGIGDVRDAFQLYTKALQQDPHRRSALIKAGSAAFKLQDYSEAERLLDSALHEPGTSTAPASEDPELQAMVTTARRIPELSLSRELPAVERATHLLLDAGIARKRLQTCTAQSAAGGKALQAAAPNSAIFSGLDARWQSARSALTRSKLEHDGDAADGLAYLIGDTEVQTAMVCGSPSGDDALLLRQAEVAHPEKGSAEPALPKTVQPAVPPTGVAR